jgi:hypothetical protein
MRHCPHCKKVVALGFICTCHAMLAFSTEPQTHHRHHDATLYIAGLPPYDQPDNEQRAPGGGPEIGGGIVIAASSTSTASTMLAWRVPPIV